MQELARAQMDLENRFRAALVRAAAPHRNDNDVAASLAQRARDDLDAAVVAVGMGKACIVGAGDVVVKVDEKPAASALRATSLTAVVTPMVYCDS